MSPVSDLAQQLLFCLEQAYADAAPEHPIPGQVCLRVGEVPFSIGTHEDLCCSGLAWVRVLRIYPSSVFPDPDTQSTPCPASQYAVEFEMGAVRCLPDHGERSGATCDEWTAAFLTVDEDAAVMRRTLCCLRETILGNPPVEDTVLMGEWVPIDGQGRCIGGTMSVTLAYDCLEC